MGKNCIIRLQGHSQIGNNFLLSQKTQRLWTNNLRYIYNFFSFPFFCIIILHICYGKFRNRKNYICFLATSHIPIYGSKQKKEQVWLRFLKAIFTYVLAFPLYSLLLDPPTFSFSEHLDLWLYFQSKIIGFASSSHLDFLVKTSRLLNLLECQYCLRDTLTKC